MKIDLFTLILLIISICSVFWAMFVIMLKIVRRRVNRKEKDKILVENHKFKLRPPTWRFQKYHPSRCPHNNGIYRKVEIKILEDTIKKTIFVCADCVSVIEVDEMEQIDKFKK